MKNYLIAFDFDGTLAKTFQKSPGGIGVHEACERVVEDIFGREGLEAYARSGGLQNRAPAETIHILLSGENRQQFIDKAKAFWSSNRERLASEVPEGKGASFEWDSGDPEAVITELFVRDKLSYLMKEFGSEFSDGSRWPRPCDGALDFLKEIEEINRSMPSEVRIEVAVITSGHDILTKKAFEMWGVDCPTVLVTDDDMRAMDFASMERKVKPGTLPIALAHKKWLGEQGITARDFDFGSAQEMKNRMIHFGDDPRKDGALAENTRIPFGFYDPEGRGSKETLPEGSLSFSDWGKLTKHLKNDEVRAMFATGRPFGEITREMERLAERERIVSFGEKFK